MPPHNEQWVTMHTAREYSGHQTVSGLDQFCRRWNAANPEYLIWRRPRMIDMVSLRRAIRMQAEQHTPGLAAMTAASRRIAAVRPHKQSATAPRQRDRR